MMEKITWNLVMKRKGKEINPERSGRLTIKVFHVKGALLVSMINKKRTPLDIAVRNDQLDTLEILTRLGAVNSITPIIQDSSFSSYTKNVRKKFEDKLFRRSGICIFYVSIIRASG